MKSILVVALSCLGVTFGAAQNAVPSASTQNSVSASDSLKQSREFYSNHHLVVVGAAPISFKLDRYPADGPERIQNDVGTYTRQHDRPWDYLPDKMRTGLPLDYAERNRYVMTFAFSKEWGHGGKPVDTKTAKQLDSLIKLIDAALNFTPSNERLIKQPGAGDYRAEWVFEIPSGDSRVHLTFRKSLESKDQPLLREFSGPITLEGGKGSATKVHFGFGYMMRADPEHEMSEFAWEEMQRGG
jgi:hypothetical protein